MGLETAVLKCIEGIKWQLGENELGYRVDCGIENGCIEMYRGNKMVVGRDGTGLQRQLWG